MNILKHIKPILFILLISAVACDDKLELIDPDNTGDVVALANEKNVMTTLVGAYDALSGTRYSVAINGMLTTGDFYGGNYFRNSELFAANNEIIFSGTFNDVSDLYRKEMIASSTEATNTWIQAYTTINIANNVLSALSVVKESNRAQVEGEALFLRGLCYFELVKMYAKPYSAGNVSANLAVPILLVEDRNSTAPVARSTVEQVYAQIVSDLTGAELKLASGPRSGKATKEAAAAYLSRVYLQMADYANARDAANRVITSGKYSLRPTFAGVFNSATTSEDIFDIPVSAVDGLNNMVIFYAATSNGGRGDIEIQAAHLATYEAGDERLDLFYIDAGTGDTRTGKWANQFGNVKAARLAEMYLTRAECNQRLATSVGATPLADINLIRSRVKLPDLLTVDLSQILKERRLELAHEGHHLHDAKRLQESILDGIIVYPYNSDKLIFPIPKRELDVNTLLIQNTGY